MQSKSTMLRLGKYMLGHKLTYAVLCITMLVDIMLNLGIAWMLAEITDAAVSLNVKAFQGLLVIGVVYLVLVGLNGFIDTWLKSKVSANIRAELRQDMMQHTLRLPQSYFDRKHSGDLLSRFTSDNQAVGNACGAVIIDLIRNPLLALASFAYLLYINWLLALICFAMGPLLFLTGKIFGKAMRVNSVRLQEQMSRTTAFLNDILGSSPVFKAFSIEGRLMKRYKSESAQVNAVEQRMGSIAGATASLSSVLGNGTFLIALLVAGLFVARGELEVGAMMAFIQLMNFLVGPFSVLPSLVASMQQSLGAAERIFEVMDAPVETEQLPEPCSSTPEFRHLSLSELGFRYPGAEKSSLNGVSAELGKGMQLAVVGPSGGGKSTLFKLLLGFYRPDAGRIAINGQDSGAMSLEQLRSYFAYVPQEAGLYTGSIRDNISNGKPDATEEEIIGALRGANAYDFVMELPQGIDTEIGEHGSRLSGGQRQRLAIARAMLKDAPILLLDEATAALDNESEKMVQQAIRKLMKDKTTLVIAHRLSTVQNADLILVMEDGEIAERGSHEELLALEGRYYELYYSQLELDQDGGGHAAVEEAETVPSAAPLRTELFRA
ncbi:ABC transporter ATP-binding protein [Paenibacillus tengchongensis]|uniref:ABC transporter ATP-binding protein n=1 Tax=Paenibacillus tengchongensis TaxID=2608684 RepID=UPI00124C5888|nr:ABC transporter ATP-binding protein [Paenibacillus tengchongensis]